MSCCIRIAALLFIFVGFVPLSAQAELSPQTEHPPTDMVDDWNLAMQFWTFRDYSFYEAIDMTAELGLSWIEAYPGQQIFPDNKEILFNENLQEDYRQQILDRLSRSGIRLINYGVAGLPDDEQKCRKIFEFAKSMGIRTIISEPEQKALPKIDSLCQAYDIHVALHNHPKPSRYWHPDTVMSALTGRSEYLGACADLGHWIRSGIAPLIGVKKVRKRLKTIHFKDVKDFKNTRAPDVLWGRGIADLDLIRKN